MMPSNHRERAGWSRRAVLGGVAASAGLALLPLAGRRQRLLVPASLDARFTAQLVDALKRAGGAPFEAVRVSSVRDVAALVDGCGSTVYTFAGPMLEAAVERALEGRQLVRLSFGTRLEPASSAASSTRHVHLALAEAFEHAGRWAAHTIGHRARLLTTGLESGYDLPFSFRHGFEAEGGEVIETSIIGQPLSAEQADVTVVLASGSDAPRLWQSIAGTRQLGALLTHPFAVGAPAGAHLVSTWAAPSATEALAARVFGDAHPVEVRISRGGEVEQLQMVPSAGQAVLAIADWSLKSGNSLPYAGC